MHNKSRKKKQARRARTLLEKTEALTPRQVDMALVAIGSMPDHVAEAVIDEMEKDPAAIMNSIRIPANRK